MKSYNNPTRRNTRRWEVAVSTVQGRRRRREVEIVFTFSLSLKTLISLGHPLYSSSLPLFTFSVFFCLPNIPFIYYLILYVFVLKILFVVKWVVFWRFLFFFFPLVEECRQSDLKMITRILQKRIINEKHSLFMYLFRELNWIQINVNGLKGCYSIYWQHEKSRELYSIEI